MNPFIVGIDLGTTNCAVAYVARADLARGIPAIRVFEIPQLTRPGAVEARPLLPSFAYLAAAGELPKGSAALLWDAANALIVGELARGLGAKVPGRMVASAKSWLCSPSVDRTAPILPWGAPEDVRRISPVQASTRYLAHIRQAWDFSMAKGDPARALAAQDIVVTVPASFDEAARELTVQAAAEAGLEKITLLEEPQAAFYAWVFEHSGSAGAAAPAPGKRRKPAAGETPAVRADALLRALEGVKCVLVCDVGGGTTDFSLIDVKLTGDPANPVALSRSAVGDHLMLGGDNMDLALARHLEKKIGGTLDAHQFKALTAAAREAKERLLDAEQARGEGSSGVRAAPSPGAKAPPSPHGGEGESGTRHMRVAPIAIMGRGSSVIGGSLRTELPLDEAMSILLDGFFPLCGLSDDPRTSGRGGIREWGLPYVHDPAVTRHLGQFLRRHSLEVRPASVPAGRDAGPTRRIPRPDAVLFNGGAMKPEAFRARVLEVLRTWFEEPAGRDAGPTMAGAGPVELASASLDLAVAVGAAYYGCVRRGHGLRIGGGMGRSYYIGIETEPDPARPTGKAALCLVPQGTEEGQALELPQTFVLRLAGPVVFPLFSSSTRPHDKLGDILDEASPDLAPLPPLETVLHGGRRAVKRDVSVRLHAGLSEVGTLALSLQSVHDEREWEIHLNIRAKTPDAGGQGRSPHSDGPPGEAGLGLDPRKLNAALALISRAFDERSREPLPPEILAKQLEAALELSKEAWPAPLARRLADALLDQAPARVRGAEYEGRWLNLAGFLLRPGFGDLADGERINRLYNATRQPERGLHFVSEPHARIEWWVLWRRVAAGLKEDHQREQFNRLQPFLFGERDVSKRGGWPRPAKGELPEMWRAAASLELLDAAQKKLLGRRLIELLEEDGPATPLLWSLGRIGARQPAHARANAAVPAALAETWLKALLALDWAGNPAAAFAAVSLARKTGDRDRDIGEALRARTLQKLRAAQAAERDLNAVKNVVELESADRKLIFGDVLPPALRLDEAVK